MQLILNLQGEQIQQNCIPRLLFIVFALLLGGLFCGPSKVNPVLELCGIISLKNSSRHPFLAADVVFRFLREFVIS